MPEEHKCILVQRSTAAQWSKVKNTWIVEQLLCSVKRKKQEKCVFAEDLHFVEDTHTLVLGHGFQV